MCVHDYSWMLLVGFFFACGEHILTDKHAVFSRLLHLHVLWVIDKALLVATLSYASREQLLARISAVFRGSLKVT